MRMPLPPMRSVSPCCVPGDIFISTSPSRVGTLQQQAKCDLDLWRFRVSPSQQHF